MGFLSVGGVLCCSLRMGRGGGRLRGAAPADLGPDLALLVRKLRGEGDEREHTEGEAEADDDRHVCRSSWISLQVPSDDVVQVLRKGLSHAGSGFVNPARGPCEEAA